MPKSRSRRSSQRRPSQPRGRQRRPAPPRVPPPTAPGLRGAVERRSAPVLTWLSQQPKVLLPFGSLALLMGGFLAPVWLAVPLLVVLLVIVSWLTYLSWPAVQGGGRVVRVATVALLVLAVVVKAAGSGSA